MDNLMARLPDMLRKNARQDAEENEYDPSEHIEWMAADEIERLQAQNKRLISRGFEDLHDETERLRVALRQIAGGEHVPGWELRDIAKEALESIQALDKLKEVSGD